MKHSEKPIQVHSSEFDDELKSQMKDILSSPYRKYVLQLKPLVLGKTVSHSQAGSSGFLLFFSDTTWVMTYLAEKNLNWQYGQGGIQPEVWSLLFSPDYADGHQPISVNLPYANETCDIKGEISKAHGKEIVGIAIGETSFNFCFPSDLELDAHIIPSPSGKSALRVFWEQW